MDIKFKSPAYAFVLPDLRKYPADFRRFIERDIIEIATLRNLENSGNLNWWTADYNQKLLPLITSGDGNCLLHAASLGIWGVHDRQLNLRNALYEFLRRSNRRSAFYRRWRWHESKNNAQSELIFSEDEWSKEWNSILRMATSTPRMSNCDKDTSNPHHSSNEPVYQSLESIHVFALSHVLRRPIIVVADKILRNARGDAISPIPFRGIYLPLECRPEHCHKSPLVLSYDASHFSPLVAMKQSFSFGSNTLAAIPITDQNRYLLPIQFSIDPGPDFTWWNDSDDVRIANEIEYLQTEDRKLELIARYLDVVRMELGKDGSIKRTTPLYLNHDEIVPSKLFTLATGEVEYARHKKGFSTSRIIDELRQHLRWFNGRKKKHSYKQLEKFHHFDLAHTNSVLTALLHGCQHQHTESLLGIYIAEAKRRFETTKSEPRQRNPKIRISRSLSNLSVPLTCITSSCQKEASPLMNFLCEDCFINQKTEFESGLTNTSSLLGDKENVSLSQCAISLTPGHRQHSSFDPALNVVNTSFPVNQYNDYSTNSSRLLTPISIRPNPIIY